jgi:hypothetical protein
VTVDSLIASPLGEGEAEVAATKAVARKGVAITPSADSRERKDHGDGSPLRRQRSRTSPTMAGGTTMAGITTPSITPSAMLDTKPIGTQFSRWTAPPPTSTQARGHPKFGRGGGGPMPPPNNVWHGQQGLGLLPTMNLLGPQGQQGQSSTPGPPGGGQNIPAATAAP